MKLGFLAWFTVGLTENITTSPLSSRNELILPRRPGYIRLSFVDPSLLSLHQVSRNNFRLCFLLEARFSSSVWYAGERLRWRVDLMCWKYRAPSYSDEEDDDASKKFQLASISSPKTTMKLPNRKLTVKEKTIRRYVIQQY
jgi:hypothetical protein